MLNRDSFSILETKLIIIKTLQHVRECMFQKKCVNIMQLHRSERIFAHKATTRILPDIRFELKYH